MLGQHVDEVDCFKYMGVNLDSHLTFVPHTQNVASKVHSCTCVPFGNVVLSFHKAWHTRFVPASQNHTFCMAAFIMMGALCRHAKILQISQNKAFRAVLKVEPRYPTEQLHRYLHKPYIADICKYHTCCLAYRSLHNLSTPYLNTCFTVLNRSMGLRSEFCPTFKRELCQTVLGSNSIFQHSHWYWSTLPIEVKNSASLNILKKSTKCTVYTYF